MAAKGWPIDGPVRNEVADARRMIYATSGGAEGVSRAGDLKVMPLDVPGPGFQVSPGSALILSRYAEGETYQAGVAQTETYPVTPTGSTPAGGRADMVVLLVRDPYAENSPWPEAPDPQAYDYFVIHTIEGVPATARTLGDIPGLESKYRTALPLYRINFPASTGTVVQGMLTDLREISQLKSRRQQDLITPSIAGLPGTTEVQFPDAVQQVRIPSWATRIRAMVRILGIMTVGPSSVEFRLRLGGTVYSAVSGLTNDAAAGASDRVDKTIPMLIDIPPAMRGTTQPLAILAKRNIGNLTTTARTSVEFDTNLEESP